MRSRGQNNPCSKLKSLYTIILRICIRCVLFNYYNNHGIYKYNKENGIFNTYNAITKLNGYDNI